MAGGDGPQEFYAYKPSLAGGVIIAILFSFLLFLHLFRLYTTRTWFCIPFSMGAIFEIIGYAARAQSNKQPHAQTPFLIQAIFILLAPILFAASVYMFLGRIIRSTGYESCSMVRPKWLTIIFVAGDVVCFFVQMVGAAMMGDAKTKAMLDLANTIVLVGLIAQIVIFGWFMLVGVVFHNRVRKIGGKLVVGGVNWERFLFWLYGVSIIITFRNLFRVIEYALGDDGYLLSTEWPIYVFDAIPMAFVLVVCNLWYVGGMDFRSNERDDIDIMIGGR
ncbi:RTA1 like protein [Periconia macrospinosa]|uniref:RTA1 like protein n=1 Tax=Periconia macrospinosa TaxID=97972 RepID=A0A2V1CZH6_9PLEO|nr:RTA1 like protein [Periconia macrospinosa]